MTSRKLFRSLMACGVSLSVVTQGAYAEACWLFQNRTTTNYAPVAVAAPACAPAPQVCSYQPQTCYRTVYVNTPVTSYQPIAGTDPCSGCPTTCMRPVTTYVTQARMVPYTTYRPVFAPAATCSTCNYSPVACAAPACGAPACATGACGQTVGYAPAVTYQPAVSIARPACSSCAATSYTPITPAAVGGLNITPTTGAPSLGSTTTFGSVAPTTRTIQSSPLVQTSPVIQTTPIQSPQSTFGAVGSSVPSLNGGVVSSPTTSRVQGEAQTAPASRLTPANSTFKDETQPAPKQDDSHLKPIPDTTSENRNTNTAIPHTEHSDRTTANPIQRAWAFTPVAKTEPARIEQPSTRAKTAEASDLDDSGWRAARR